MYNVIVFMSTFNGEKFLKEQLNSIFNQKNCNIKVLVRDDGSVDNTVKILEYYHKNYSLEYYKGENCGPAKSFLELLYTSIDAQYYAFADQDDIWNCDKIENAIVSLEENGSKMPLLYCSNLTPFKNYNEIIIDKLLGISIATEYTQILSRSSDIFGCTMVWNFELQSLILKTMMPYKVTMHDYWVALVAACYGKIIYDNVPSIMYRQHTNNQVGANLSFIANWKDRFSIIFKGTKFPATITASEMLKIIEQLECVGIECGDKHKNYTKLVANYRNSIYDKIKYIISANMSAMNFKQKCFHIIMVLTSRL